MGRVKEAGFTIIELLIVIAIILVIAAFGIPSLLRSRMAANEASAVASIRTLNTAILAYSTTYSTDPSTLADLGPATIPTANAADLIDQVLAADPAIKGGYSIAYVPGAGPTITSYTLTATPVSASTGQRKFFADESGVIRQTTDGSTPTASSTPID